MRRIAQIVHVSPGRLRLRMTWLRRARDEAGPLAERVSKIHGVQQIEIRPYTGSVLCLHDPLAIETEALLEAIRGVASLERMLRPDEAVPLVGMDTLLGMVADGSRVGREVSVFFRELDRDLMLRSEGKIDLATATSFTFAVAAAIEIAVTRKLPMPPWFNLGWWAYRTFATRPPPTFVPHHREEEADPGEGVSPFYARAAQ